MVGQYAATMFDDAPIAPSDDRMAQQLPRRRARESAAEFARRVRPQYTERRKKNIDQATSAVIGVAANLGVAAVAGLVGGRIHPDAPPILYSILATITGFIVAEENPTMGNVLTASGMVSGASLIMKGVVAVIVKTSASAVPSSPFDVANRVAQAVSPTPTPSATPSPSETPRVPYITPTPTSSRA